MNHRRSYWLMLGLTVLSGLLLVAAVVCGNLLLKKRAATLTSLKVDSQVLEEQDKAITQANQDIKKYSSLSQIAGAIVPQDKDQAKTVREIVNIARASGVSLGSFTFPNSTLGTTTPAPAASSTGTASKAATPSVTQVTPLKDIPGVYEMQIGVSSGSSLTSYPQLISFLQGLEQNRRTAQVTQLSIQPDAKTPSLVKFTMQINVYIKP